MAAIMPELYRIQAIERELQVKLEQQREIRARSARISRERADLEADIQALQAEKELLEQGQLMLPGCI